MSKHYKLQKGTSGLYKIHVTTKWFGYTVWTSMYCYPSEYGCHDVSWTGKQDALDVIRRLQHKEVYKDVIDE
jgi:inorganic pyrophosphatase